MTTCGMTDTATIITGDIMARITVTARGFLHLLHDLPICDAFLPSHRTHNSPRYFLPLPVVVDGEADGLAVAAEDAGSRRGRTDCAPPTLCVGSPLLPGRCAPEGVVPTAGRCGVFEPEFTGGLGSGL